MLTHQCDLLLRIGSEAVEGYDDRLPEALEVLDMAVEVSQPMTDALDILRLEILLIDTTVHLQPAEGSHEDGERRLEACRAALDVVELLCAEIRTEASLRDRVVGVRQCHVGGEDRVAAVGDVSKRTAVDEGRGMLSRLCQIGLDSVEEEDGDRTRYTEVTHGKGLPLLRIAEEDILDTATQVFE